VTFISFNKLLFIHVVVIRRFVLTSIKMGLFFNVVLAVFAATGSFLFGYDSGVMTIVIASPNFLHYKTKQESAIIGAINATFSGGAVFGSFMFVKRPKRHSTNADRIKGWLHHG
jgi:hypothetical protein